jgi:hypothetical protein
VCIGVVLGGGVRISPKIAKNAYKMCERRPLALQSRPATIIMQHVLDNALANVEMYPTCMAKPANYEASAPVATKEAGTIKDPMLNIRARAASLYMRNGQRNAIECANRNVVLDEHNRVVPTGIMKTLQERLNERRFQTTGVVMISKPATIPIANNIIKKRSRKGKKCVEEPEVVKSIITTPKPIMTALDLALGFEDYV